MTSPTYDTAKTRMIPVSNEIFLGSVLHETWDTRQAVASGYIDTMMPASDVDLTVSIAPSLPGSVSLHFDPTVYPSSHSDGPRWMAEVDGTPLTTIVAMGPGQASISTPNLDAGTHRVRFVQVGLTSWSNRWAPHDPQLSRITGVTIPAGATLQKSQRSASWFLPITDSIGEGFHNLNPGRRIDDKDAVTNTYFGWPSIVGRLMKKSMAGYMISGIGIVHSGIGTTYGTLNPADDSGASDSWDHIFEGVPRPFTTAPDFILLCVGTNEFATDGTIPGHASNTDPSSVDANFQANLEKFFARVRSKPPLATIPLYISVPFGGFKRTAIQTAVAAYKAAHLDEANLVVFDLAFGSPALTTTDGIDEVKLFGGLTKNRADDRDTLPSAQAPDRTHPYAIATADIGSVDAHTQIAKVMAARLATLLAGGPAPKTGPLTAGNVQLAVKEASATLTASRTTGGSAPYTHQFQKRTSGDPSWIAVGNPIDNQASTLDGLRVIDHDYADGTVYRLVVTDASQSQAISSNIEAR